MLFASSCYKCVHAIAITNGSLPKASFHKLVYVINTLCFGDPCHLSLLKTVNFDFHTQIAYIAIHCKRCNSIHSLQQCINEVLDYECHTLGYYAYYKKIMEPYCTQFTKHLEGNVHISYSTTTLSRAWYLLYSCPWNG